MTQNDKNKNKNYKSDTNNTTVDPNNKYNDNDTINNSNDSYDEFIIPKNSFTSFRLKYSDPKQIYMNSLSISIGPIPHIWILDKKKDSLRNLIFKLKSSNDFKSSKISSHDVRHQFSKHLDKDYNSLPQINFDHINIEKENIARKQFIPNINDNNNISETPAITEPDNNKISKEKSKSHIKETKSDSEFLKKLDKNFNNHKDYNDSFMDRSERFTKELNSKLHEKKEKLSNSDVNDSNSFHHHSRNGQLDSKPQKLYVNQLEIINSNSNETQSIKSSDTNDSYSTDLSKINSDSSNSSKSDKFKSFLSTKFSIKNKFNKFKKSHTNKDKEESLPIPLPTSKKSLPTANSNPTFEKGKNKETTLDEQKPRFNTSKSLDANHYTDNVRQPRSILKHVFSEPVLSNVKTQVRIQDFNSKNEALDNFTSFLNNLSHSDDFDDDDDDSNDDQDDQRLQVLF
ncbi:unnamed protein product [[Candida] boidinii]|nr:unnamed protein product [[Candida] boidinii]